MTPTIVAEGLEFPEGPVWLGPKRVAVTEIKGQCISLWENGTLRRKVGVTGGGANGATLGADGALYVANNGGVSLGHEGKWMASAACRAHPARHARRQGDGRRHEAARRRAEPA